MLNVLEYPTTEKVCQTVVPANALPALVAEVYALLVGTGGADTVDYYRQRGARGYPFAQYAASPSPSTARLNIQTPSEDLTQIRTVLKLSVTDLAFAMRVSRQAIYDWQNGKTVAVENAERLADFARAAETLSYAGVTADPQLTRRAIHSGKNLLDIARDGGSLTEAAEVLIGTLQGEAKQRQALADRLRGRKRPTSGSIEDYGLPLLNEVG